MWNDCQFPRGKMWIWRPEDAIHTYRAESSQKEPMPCPKKNKVPLTFPLKPTAKFREPSSLPFVSVPSVWAPILSALLGWFLILRDMAMEVLALLQKYLQAEKAKKTTVSLSELILASQKPLLPLKLVSWSREGSWDSASSHSYRVSHQKAPGIAPAGIPSKPCLHHLWLFSPHTCQKTVPSLGECRELPFHKEPPANFGWRRATLYIAKELGLPAKGI